MKESRKTLLRLIYQHEQVNGGIFQIPADGSSIGFDSLTLRNDVAYLCRHGYVEEPTHILRCYCLCLAPKGEECIEGIQRVICEMEEIVYQGISREEILLMKRLLTEMKNNLLNSKDFKGVDMDTIIEKTCPSARGSF